MPLKTYIFLFFLLLLWGLSLFKGPFFGILAYIINYNISPANQWWGKPLYNMGIRFSFFSYIFLVLGILVHRNKIRFYSIDRQEFLLFVLVLLLWLSHIISPKPLFYSTSEIDVNALKLTKIFLFLLVFTRTIINKYQLDQLLVIIILLLLIQGIFAWQAPSSAFFRGRLNMGFGGPDFRDSNFLAAHFASFLPFVLVFFFIKKNLKLKLLALFSLVFSINTIILTRTRGVFLALFCSFFLAFILSCFFRKYLKYMLIMLVGGLILFLSLVDQSFWQRISTIKQAKQEENLDKSAAARLIIWKAALQMIKKYPLGVGDGQFKLFIGDFDFRVKGRDAHNTFVRCAGELGIPGLLVFITFIFLSFKYSISLVIKTYKGTSTSLFWYSIACFFAIFIRFISCLFSTHLYVEEFYLIFILPLLLNRLYSTFQRR